MKNLLRLIPLLALSSIAAAGDFLGDFAPGTTAICGQFTTYNASLAPTTLAGSPVFSVYKIGDGTNSTTESTTGVTHAEDVDSRTGMNRVCVDTSADGTFYSAGGQFSIVITTGTVNSVSVVGSEVKSFSLNKVAALRPTVAGRTADIASTGEIGLDFGNVAIPTGVIGALGAGHSGTMQSGSAAGTAVLASGANSNDNYYNNGLIFIYSGTGAGQGRNCLVYTGSTRTCTVGPSNWTTTPDNTSVYLVYGTAGASLGTDSITAAALAADAGVELGTATWATTTRRLTELDEDNTTMDLNATTIGTVTTATNLTNAPTSGDLTATMKTSVQTAVQAAQGILAGTCSSGSTTTCVDAALTQADATQLQDRLICFNDGWCAMLTTFNPATDTATTTKTAPSTRASKTYTIFPSTAQ